MSNFHSSQGNAHGHQMVTPNQQLQDVSQTLGNQGESLSNSADANNETRQYYREVHDWPTISRHALGNIGPGDKAIKAVCPICSSEISVAGLPRPEDGGKQGFVTPCGHAVCHECWPEKKLLSPAQGEGQSNAKFEERECPVCKKALDCLCCGRSCIKLDVPGHSFDAMYVRTISPTQGAGPHGFLQLQLGYRAFHYPQEFVLSQLPQWEY
ncbi:hypothetical protein FLONG3_9034 [Fusarium longipes]|uniref:RING-type domain-containing protein n=1 Tax=Fusarium longipes TaxID=694270 RepID=A0A395S1F0_9HYPO|nr:hypothetical protein FLONG3_9034 [Fusarium longipes]